MLLLVNWTIYAYIDTSPEIGVDRPSMDKVILQPNTSSFLSDHTSQKSQSCTPIIHTWIMCHTHLHASLEKTGAIISTNLHPCLNRQFQNEKSQTKTAPE